MRTELNIGPGEQHSGSVGLSNDSTDVVRVQVELLDFFIDPGGTPQFAAAWPDEAALSCRDWLRLNPMETELAGGQQMQVRYTLQVPEGVPEGSYHCAAGFTTQAPAASAPVSQLRMAVRVVAAFYVIVGSPAVDGVVTEMRLEPAEDMDEDPLTAVVILENRGGMYFRATGDLSMLDPEGAVVQSTPFLGIPILPRREQRFQFPVSPGLAPGPYLLRSRVDIGTNEIQEVVVPVVVPTTVEPRRR